MNTPQNDVVQRKDDDSDAPALVPLVDITVHVVAEAE
jgi:hypothetical protein